MLRRVIPFFLLCGAMWAGPCLPGSLTSYVNLGASGCNVGALRYFNFTTSFAENTDTIQVLPNSIPFGPGLGFSPPPVAQNTNATFSINYTIDPPPIIVRQFDILDPPTGNVAATQLFCVNQLFFGVGGNCADSTPPLSLPVSFPGSPSATLQFGALESMLDVRTIITETGGAFGASIDHLLTETDIVPEPATIGLTAAAMLALAGWRRRSLNKG